MEDEDLLVRLEAIEVAVEIMQTKINEDQIEKDLLPSFVKHLEIEQEEDCDLKMSSLFGKFLFYLPLEKQRRESAKSFINFFNRIRKSHDPVLQKNAAFNLPCFFYYFGNYEDSDLDIQEIYSEFAAEDIIEIKCIVAKGIHEALDILSK